MKIASFTAAAALSLHLGTSALAQERCLLSDASPPTATPLADRAGWGQPKLVKIDHQPYCSFDAPKDVPGNKITALFISAKSQLPMRVTLDNGTIIVIKQDKAGQLDFGSARGKIAIDQLAAFEGRRPQFVQSCKQAMAVNPPSVK